MRSANVCFGVLARSQHIEKSNNELMNIACAAQVDNRLHSKGQPNLRSIVAFSNVFSTYKLVLT